MIRRGPESCAGLRIMLYDLARRFHPVHLRHQQIQQDDVRIEPGCQIYGFEAVRSLSDHFHVLLHLDEHAQSLADNGMVIQHNHADFLSRRDRIARMGDLVAHVLNLWIDSTSNWPTGAGWEA